MRKGVYSHFEANPGVFGPGGFHVRETPAEMAKIGKQLGPILFYLNNLVMLFRSHVKLDLLGLAELTEIIIGTVGSLDIITSITIQIHRKLPNKSIF